MNFKNIHAGKMVEALVAERRIEKSRIYSCMECTESELSMMYQNPSLETDVLLKWSKLLEYDFFRIYSQHLILYVPSVAKTRNASSHKSLLPRFRKNIYTQEIIEFILEQIDTGEKDKYQIIKEYRIPKTTLYKWIEKNRK